MTELKSWLENSDLFDWKALIRWTEEGPSIGNFLLSEATCNDLPIPFSESATSLMSFAFHCHGPLKLGWIACSLVVTDKSRRTNWSCFVWWCDNVHLICQLHENWMLTQTLLEPAVAVLLTRLLTWSPAGKSSRSTLCLGLTVNFRCVFTDCRF